MHFQAGLRERTCDGHANRVSDCSVQATDQACLGLEHLRSKRENDAQGFERSGKEKSEVALSRRKVHSIQLKNTLKYKGPKEVQFRVLSSAFLFLIRENKSTICSISSSARLEMKGELFITSVLTSSSSLGVMLSLKYFE